MISTIAKEQPNLRDIVAFVKGGRVDGIYYLCHTRLFARAEAYGFVTFDIRKGAYALTERGADYLTIPTADLCSCGTPKAMFGKLRAAVHAVTCNAAILPP